MDKIDANQLMKLSCDIYLTSHCGKMSVSQLSGLYWLCNNLGPYWDASLIQNVERRLVELLRHEIATQKQLDGDFDADVPEGLQTVSLSDISLIERYYENSPELLQKSQHQREVLSLID